MVDPTIQQVFWGVIANTLTSLIAQLARKSGKLITGEKLLQKIKQKDTSLQHILKSASEEIAEKIECEGPVRIEEVCLFLTSPEAEAIVRQIYSSKLSEGRNNLELIQKEFLISFSLYTGLEKEKLANLANLLFEALVDACEEALNQAVDVGILAAHDAKSAFRYRIILDELATINKNIALLTSKHKPELNAIFEFEKKYRQQVSDRHGFIIPPHFDVARKIPIDNIFVAPNFVTTVRQKGEELRELKMTDFLSVIYRAVLLGNPGGGKSTFVSKLSYDLASRYSERLFAGRS